MRLKIIKVVIFFAMCHTIVAHAQNLTEVITAGDADWGIWIDNGLVNPGEPVSITVSLPLRTRAAQLPSVLAVHPRYLEDKGDKQENIRLKWKKVSGQRKWLASVVYRPNAAGNYYAAVTFLGQELFSYFAAWKPGLTGVNFWMDMPAEFHDTNNLKDLFLPEIRRGHLPVDYELVLVGERVFGKNWEPRKLFRQAQVECGAEVIPFLDGGYFHKLDSTLTDRFNSVKNKIQGYEHLVGEETRAVHGLYKLPDPTFQTLTVNQCSTIIAGAQRYWKEWGFHPFTGISTYSPSNELVESCRAYGLKWISGVFADYDFTDGSDRWDVGWRQRHRGMPSFPYLISATDYRWTGKADPQSTMIFPGWQNLPVWDHEDKHGYGTDLSSFNGYGGLSPLERMMLFSEVFERNDRLAENKFPLVETFCVQMNNPANGAMLSGLVERARQGKLIFIHKRYLQSYYNKHKISANPDICYTIPDAQLAAGRRMDYNFSHETVWEGAEGKAAFISEPTAPLKPGRSIYTPVWWYDYRNAKALSPDVNLTSVNLSGLSVQIRKEGNEKMIIINSEKSFNKLPICLWDQMNDFNPDASWIKKYNAMKVAAPEKFGKNATTWIIRPVITPGITIVPIKN